ncbi:guanosine-diphosphatase [Cryptococcus neoformans Ze90-1]|nr:guanosine-diphosphatase [Cryptococcus neoformans var. grubii Ze90-1]
MILLLPKPRMLLKPSKTLPTSPSLNLRPRLNLLPPDHSSKTRTPLRQRPVPSPYLLTSLSCSTRLPSTLVPRVPGSTSTNSTTAVRPPSWSMRHSKLSSRDFQHTLVTRLRPLLLLTLCLRRHTGSFPRVCESVRLWR